MVDGLGSFFIAVARRWWPKGVGRRRGGNTPELVGSGRCRAVVIFRVPVRRSTRSVTALMCFIRRGDRIERRPIDFHVKDDGDT